MPRSLSKSQIDKLGERLAAAQLPTYEELDALEQLRSRDYASARDGVIDVLRSFGVIPGKELTARLKTNATIIDKLRRGTSLSSMQDLAGVRVTRRMTLAQQDEFVTGVTRRIVGPNGEPWFKIKDRRAAPVAGYRALHVIVRLDGCPVEIQVRTVLQHLWAQTFELLANRPEFGREIRYGGRPAQDRTRLGHATEWFVSTMMAISGGIADFEWRAGDAPERQTPVEMSVRTSLAKLLDLLGEPI